MKIESKHSKLKDIRGRRITGYRARFGDLSADAPTPQEAEQGLAYQVEKACQAHYTRVVSVAGYVAVISWSGFQWCYQVLETADCKGSKPKSHHAGSSAKTEQEAEKLAMRQIAERILFKNWRETGEPNLPELAFGLLDEATQKELLDNIAWQRKYRDRFAVAREYGMGECQADLYAREAPGVSLPAEKPSQGVLL